MSDDVFMREALSEARQAADKGEVPIGAVVVWRNKIIGRGHNLTEQLKDATAHAEMQALTSAMHTAGGKYLPECTLYVTLEPCPMCAAASAWAQVGRIVYGADDPKRGYARFGATILHPKTSITKGVLAKECEELIKEFFNGLRSTK